MEAAQLGCCPNMAWLVAEAVSYLLDCRAALSQVICRDRFYLDPRTIIVRVATPRYVGLYQLDGQAGPSSGQFALACQADMDPSNQDLASLGVLSFYSM